MQLQQYRQQIEELENHLTTQSSGNHITPQGKSLLGLFIKDVLISLMQAFFFGQSSCTCIIDLTLAMQKLYQTFVAQAAQLQSVHENVKVGSLLLVLSFKKYTIIKLIWTFREN